MQTTANHPGHRSTASVHIIKKCIL